MRHKPASHTSDTESRAKCLVSEWQPHKSHTCPSKSRKLTSPRTCSVSFPWSIGIIWRFAFTSKRLGLFWITVSHAIPLGLWIKLEGGVHPTWPFLLCLWATIKKSWVIHVALQTQRGSFSTPIMLTCLWLIVWRAQPHSGNTYPTHPHTPFFGLLEMEKEGEKATWSRGAIWRRHRC